jgi:uncharacterized protein (DUF4415 family)
MSAKPKLLRNTPEEEAAIQRGIAADPDTYEVPTEDFEKMKRLGQRGRPRMSSPKELVSIRYDAQVIESFRAMGDGWQTKMNDALAEWLREHQSA